MTQAQTSRWYQRGPGLIATGPLLVAYIISNALLSDSNAGAMPNWERIGLALLPLPFFAWAMWRFINKMRSSDELKRRIQLEALGIAFPASIALLLTLGLLQIGHLPLIAYKHLWVGLLALYALGRAIAERRYR